MTELTYYLSVFSWVAAHALGSGDDVPTYVEFRLTREKVIAKARDLTEPVIGDTSTSRLIDRMLELETIKDIHELRPLLQWTNSAGPPRLSEYPYSNETVDCKRVLH